MHRRSIEAVRLFITMLVAAVSVAAFADQDGADKDGFAVGSREVSFTDESRPVKASSGFAGAPVRRLDVSVWYPAARPGQGAALAAGGPWPLVIYSHGTNGAPNNNMNLVNELVRHGYVVAAPAYPLSSLSTYTHIRMTDIGDVANQTKDIRFIVDRMIADPLFGPAIDAARIGTTGHSLGAVTSYFTSFGLQTRDPRIKAVALTGAGDPVTTALAGDMGLWGTQHAAASVPVLFLSAEKDVFARTTGRPHAAYSRLEKPKYEVMVRRGTHVWFRDGNEQPTDNKNPDCLFFERNMPGVTMPGCEERVPLIAPARQQQITRTAVRTFFDAYLKNDATALARLRQLDREFAEVELRRDD